MLYVAFSGGADSTATAILLHERGEEYELVFADTGAELPETYYMVTRVASVLGKKLNVVSNGTFYQHLVSYNWMLPGVRLRWCTGLLKQLPQERFYPEGATVAVGIRADEAHRQANVTGRNGTTIKPLVDAGMDKRDVFALCRRYELLNPVYKWRSSVSCFCCPFQRKSDWLGLLRHHPELYALAEQWEEQAMAWAASHPGVTTRASWHDGRTLRQLREADECQLKLWPEPDEEPCAICAW